MTSHHQSTPSHFQSSSDFSDWRQEQQQQPIHLKKKRSSSSVWHGKKSANVKQSPDKLHTRKRVHIHRKKLATTTTRSDSEFCGSVPDQVENARHEERYPKFVKQVQSLNLNQEGKQPQFCYTKFGTKQQQWFGKGSHISQKNCFENENGAPFHYSSHCINGNNDYYSEESLDYQYQRTNEYIQTSEARNRFNKTLPWHSNSIDGNVKVRDKVCPTIISDYRRIHKQRESVFDKDHTRNANQNFGNQYHDCSNKDNTTLKRSGPRCLTIRNSDARTEVNTYTTGRKNRSFCLEDYNHTNRNHGPGMDRNWDKTIENFREDLTFLESFQSVLLNTLKSLTMRIEDGVLSSNMRCPEPRLCYEGLTATTGRVFCHDDYDYDYDEDAQCKSRRGHDSDSDRNTISCLNGNSNRNEIAMADGTDVIGAGLAKKFKAIWFGQGHLLSVVCLCVSLTVAHFAIVYVIYYR